MLATIATVNSRSSMRATSTKFAVPYSMLQEWCYGVWKSHKQGLDLALNAVEEQQIIDYLVAMLELGYGLPPIAFKLKVYDITKGMWTPFWNGILGRGWMRCW